MKMNSGFNINLIITCEIKLRVVISAHVISAHVISAHVISAHVMSYHTVISAHVWPVDEASSYQTCDYQHRVGESHDDNLVCF